MTEGTHRQMVEKRVQMGREWQRRKGEAGYCPMRRIRYLCPA